MKRLAMMIAVLALVMSLAACGCTDKNATNTGTTGNSGTTQNGGGTSGNKPTGNNGGSNSGGGNSMNSGNNSGSNGMNGGMNNGVGTPVPPTDNGGIMDDMENAADNVGDAVDDLFGGGNSANNGTTNNGGSSNGANATPTTFQRMISNARVHDTDGILTDGENSHW